MLRHPTPNSSAPTVEEEEVRSPSPSIILRRDNDFLTSQKSAWDSSSDPEEEAAAAQKVPDVRKDDLASRRAHRGAVAPRVHQFVPPVCSNKDRERWEGIRRASQQTLQETEIRLAVCLCLNLPFFFHFLQLTAKYSFPFPVLLFPLGVVATCGLVCVLHFDL